MSKNCKYSGLGLILLSLMIFSIAGVGLLKPEMLFGKKDLKQSAGEIRDVAIAQKALTQMQTSMQPKSGDMVFPSSYINQRGMTTWQWGTIIDPHTGAMSGCVLDNGAALRVIGVKAEQVLLVVSGDQKQVGSDTCAKGQEILLLVEIVTEFQKKRAHMLQMETKARDENAKNLELIKAIKSEAANR